MRDDDVWEDDYEQRRYAPTPEDMALSGSKTDRSSAIIWLVLLGGGALACVLVGVVVFFTSLRNKVLPVAVLQTEAVAQAESRRAFDEFDALVDHSANLPPEAMQERTRIEGLLDLLRLRGANSSDGWTSEFDKRRFWERIQFELPGQRAPFPLVVPFADPDPEDDWKDLELVAIYSAEGDPESRVVYCLAGELRGFDQGPPQTPYRLWVTLADGQCRLYDWENLLEGMTQSRLWAVCDSTPAVSQRVQAFFNSLTADFNQVRELVTEGRRKEAEQKVMELTRRSFPSGLHDYCLILVGRHAQHHGFTQIAKDCFEKLDSPTRAPLAYEALANLAHANNPQESLRQLNLYEQHLGSVHHILKDKAAALYALGRAEEAQTVWRKVLKQHPRSSGALLALVEDKSPESQAAVFEVLAKLPDRMTVIHSLVETSRYRSLEGLTRLVEHLRVKSPQSMMLKFAEGHLAAARSGPARAVEFFHEVLAQDADSEAKAGVLYEYLTLMAKLKRLPEAISQVADPREAFHQLLDERREGYREGADPEWLAAVRAYRAREPNDVMGALEEATQLFESEQYEEAEALIRAAQKLEPDAENESTALLTSLSLRCRVLRGAVEEIIQSRETSIETLLEVAEQLEAVRNWKDLKRVIGALQERRAEESDFKHYVLRLAIAEERFADVWAMAQQELSAAGNDSNWRLSTIIRSLPLTPELVRKWYTASGNKVQAFRQLNGIIRGRRDWESFDELVRLHQAQENSQELHEQQAEAAYQRGNYQAALRHARAALAMTSGDAWLEWERGQIEKIQFDCLLRLGERAEALHLAQQVTDVHRRANRLAKVYAMGDMPDAAIDAVLAVKAVNRRRPQAFDRVEVYFDDITGSKLMSPAYDRLHLEWPVSISGRSGQEPVATALLTEPVALSAALIAKELEVIDPTNGAFEVSVLPSDASHPERFVARRGKTAIVCSAENRAIELPFRVLHSAEPFASRVKHAKAAFHVDVIGWTYQDRQTASRVARQLTLKLAGDKLSLVAAGWFQHLLVLPTSSCLELWVREETIGFDQPHTLSGSTITTWPNPVAFRERLLEAVRKFEAGEITALEVGCTQDRRPASEEHWVVVSAINRKPGEVEFRGKLKQSSALISELRASLPVSIEMNEITAISVSGEVIRSQ